ncbi:4Fe-4S binding protein [Anabaena sp. FACHB-1237]|uniref:4Fe-4S dicluster domain-containing protein n=1 Tax=Anabaena sp. FACHB-1237 TaxID=2692769 RepID=UPI001681BC9F|nr:4Fe-4S dicluster domain-containing protein [Anabaena sp. FACHB-1237]MBD2138726.1 4Fe-4S binding protein [Anabaena sp. FACHB-1237]
MAYKITAECISCKRCLSVCPNGAITMVDNQHHIDAKLCTNCAGSIHTVPQCKAVCPTYDGCVEETTDYWESWFKKYNQLIAKLTNKQDYWECWYKTYSQKFSEQLQKNQVII